MEKKLLYYNPNFAVREDMREFPGMEKFSFFFKLFSPTVVFLDRTNTIQIPVRTHSLFPMPDFRPMQKTFEEICNERALELLVRADKLGVGIYAMYSGGIDSTLLLISLLKNATPAQRKNITVLLNEESIQENPNFYRDHIVGKLKIESSIMFPYLLGGQNLIIGGEHNDQLFGSDVVGKLVAQYGPEVIHKPYRRDTFFEFFNGKVQNPSIVNFYLDLFERLATASPIPLVSHFDRLWWINFSLKWQSVFMRMLSYTTPRNVGKVTREYIQANYNHFYGTEDFQLWSLNNQDKKIKGEWNTYKWPCKDIIYDYTKDADYRDNKIKRGSLYFLLVQQSSYNFIDEQMHFSRELDPAVYYNSENDFT